MKLNWNKIENLDGRRIKVVFYPKNRLAVESVYGGERAIVETLSEAKFVCERHAEEKNESGTYCMEDPAYCCRSIQEAKFEAFYEAKYEA